MLTRFHKVLIALLVVQLVLVVVVLSRGNDAAALKEHPLLAGFDAAKVTRVQVFAKADAKPVDLVKRDAAWVLASSFDYPVDAAKLTDLLTPVAKLSAAAPIATQTGRHKQLKVADAEFERKLVITSAGKDVTLYLGGPAGARRTAVRISGDDNVYGVTGLSSGAVSGEPRSWVDPVYAKVPVEEISKVLVQREAGGVALTHELPPPPADAGSGSAAAPPPPAADHWSAAIGDAPIALAAGETIDEQAISRIAAQAATIDLTAPADPKRSASTPTATITIERTSTGKATAAPVVIDVIADGASYWVHDRSQPRAALVDKSRLDDLLGATRDKLVKKPPPPPPSPSAGAGAGSAKPPGAAPPPPVRPG